MKAKVYFTREITPEKVLEIYNLLNKDLPGKVAIKVHSGEEGNQNFLRPDFWKPIVDKVNGTVVECNTAYEGARNTTEKHTKLIKKHGWNTYFKVDLLDAYDILSFIKNTGTYEKRFDINSDGEVNLLDVYDVLYYIKNNK